MHYAITTPPVSQAHERPSQIDDALVAEARACLLATLSRIPPAATITRSASQALFALPMSELSAGSRARGVPVEKVIVAIKLAWASLPDARLRLGDTGSEALAGAVTACIEAYFLSERSRRAD